MRPVGGLLVAANATFVSGKDFTGKTIAVNTLHSIDQIAALSWIDQSGGDSRSVKFIELPNVTMVDAIIAGRIDGAVIADPGFSTGLESGRVRNLTNVNDAIAKRFFVSAWFTTKTWAAANSATLRKFNAAINDASAWAVKNPGAAAAVLLKYLHLTTPLAHERHADKLDPALLQPLIDAAVRYKVLPQPLDARDIIWRA